jgi:hypothetical protein
MNDEARGPFLPLLLIGATVLVWMLFQTTQLISEHGNLGKALASQVQPLEQSKKLRAALDSVASNTQRLADSGDASAKLLVDELRKRGITINPNAAAQPAPR